MFWAGNIRGRVRGIVGVEAVSRCRVSSHMSDILGIPSIVRSDWWCRNIWYFRWKFVYRIPYR